MLPNPSASENPYLTASPPPGDLSAPTVYACLLYELLSNAPILEIDVHALGYRNVPASVWGVPVDEYVRLHRAAHAPFDEMPDEEFLDWLLYSKEPLPIPAEIVRGHERTLYPAQDAIEEELTARFGLFSGVPGFFNDGKSVRLSKQFYSRGGFLVPVRCTWQIVGLLHYWSATDESPRWLTSRDLESGAKATPSIHVARPHRAQELRRAVVVAHPLEADALAAQYDECVIGVNGLPAFQAARQIRRALPDLRYVGVGRTCRDNYLPKLLAAEGLTVRAEKGGES
jgi:hypothetical protein